jgi:hypothetical protein
MTVQASGYCVNHDPSISPEEKRNRRRLGGLASTRKNVEKKIEALTGKTAEIAAGDPAPDYRTADGVRTYLERQSRRVANGELAPSQADAIGRLAGLAVKLAELQLERDLLDAEIDSVDKPRRRSTR